MSPVDVYETRQQGVRWSVIAVDANRPVEQVLAMAREHAILHGLPWPVKTARPNPKPNGSPSLRKSAKAMLDLMRFKDEGSA